MTTCYLSPIGNNTQTSTSGAPLSGGLIYTYQAGTSNPQATYADNTGAVGQSNPIVLNTYGLPASPIWLVGGQSYKFIIKDSLGNTIRTVDNVSGINDAVKGPAFSAYKSANQAVTSGVATLVTFDTEDFDTNSTFASSRWTPGVASICDLAATVSASASSGVASVVFVEIWKNGAAFARGYQSNGGDGAVQSASISLKASVNATDYFEVYASITATGPTVAGSAPPRLTYFSGVVSRFL